LDHVVVYEAIGIVLLVLFSSVFSSLETALTTLTSVRALQVIEETGRHKSILTHWVERPNHVLTTIVVGNTIVNITASSVGTDLTYRVLSSLGVDPQHGLGVAIAIGVITFVVLVFGEVVPKTYAKHNALRVLSLSPIYLAAEKLLNVVTRVLAAIALPIVRVFGGQTEGKKGVTEADIEYMIRAGAEEGGLDSDQQELLSSAIEFTDTIVREVMVPRTEVQAYDLDEPVEALFRLIQKHQFSRYPVYRSHLDKVVGIFYAKDLLSRMLQGGGPVRTAAEVEAMLHKPYLVPDSKKISELLGEFQDKKVHLAVVVDEFGGTAGIVTMEDVLEELVGDINDEFDVDEQTIRELGPRRWLVNARIDLSELADGLGLTLPEDPAYSTLGGYLIAQAGRIPAKGHRFAHEHFQLLVRDADERRVRSVEVQQLTDTTPRPTQG